MASGNWVYFRDADAPAPDSGPGAHIPGSALEGPGENGRELLMGSRGGILGVARRFAVNVLVESAIHFHIAFRHAAGQAGADHSLNGILFRELDVGKFRFSDSPPQ